MIIAVKRYFPAHGRLKEAIGGAMTFAVEHPDVRLCFPGSNIFVDQTMPAHIDGIIGSPPKPDSPDSAFPVVNIMASPRPGAIHVTSDDSAIARMAYEHFRNLGLRHLAILDSARLNGVRCSPFVEVCREGGIIPYVFRFGKGQRGETKKQEHQQLSRQLRSLPKPAGLFLTLDAHASIILKICEEAGVRVPQDLALLGCDNDSVLCLESTPSLSSIDTNGQAIGYAAMEVLTGLIRGEDMPETVAVPPKEVISRESTNMTVSSPPDITKVLDFMHANLAEPIEVEDMVAQQELERRSLERRFREYSGESLLQHLISLRLQKIRHLLETTDQTAASIGHQCGIPGATYLCRLFRQKYGMTPLEYRKEAKELFNSKRYSSCSNRL